MIKTEFLDDDFNEVEPDKATRIIQMDYDDKGIVTKRVEWIPKNKTGYPESRSSIQKKVDYESLSKELSKHYLGSVEDIQLALKLCWENYDKITDIALSNEILRTIFQGHKTFIETLSGTRFMIDEEIRKASGSRW